MRRRHFLQSALSSAAGSALGTTLARSLLAAVPNRPPRILLRSSWQVVNIGDIAHTPGVISLLERHLPGVDIRLWASADLSPEVEAMEQRRFPGLQVVKGTLGEDGQASNRELAAAVEWADFLLHGSGPALVAGPDLSAFAKHTGKPFGVYGITYGSFFTAPGDNEILSAARFAYFRDSDSLAKAKSDGVTCPVMEFAPDGAFACDLRDDATAAAFLQANGLTDGNFFCCIPRLRWTPYWQIRGTAMDARAQERHARNEAMADQDHAPLREAITAVARETRYQVLVCPEDVSQMAVGRRWIVDRLPADVQKRVVWREKFWLTDEALSTYVRSAGVFGLEMHSPIMSLGNGVPAIVCRFAEQTSKGIMWRDIGLENWLFDFDREEQRRLLAPAVLAIANDPNGAKDKVAVAREFVERRQRESMAVVRNNLSSMQRVIP